jgi:hypothetical protein
VFFIAVGSKTWRFYQIFVQIGYPAGHKTLKQPEKRKESGRSLTPRAGLNIAPEPRFYAIESAFWLGSASGCMEQWFAPDIPA